MTDYETLTLNGYQQKVCLKFNHVPRGNRLEQTAYLALAMAGEAGEVANEVKKAWRDDGQLTPERVLKLVEELGDTLWYLNMLAWALDKEMSTVVQVNHEKIKRRYNAQFGVGVSM